MRLYRRIIPKIAREIIRSLNASGDIEVNEGKLDEAELDLAAVAVEYCNQEDRLAQDARDAIHRRGLNPERFGQVKKGLADAKGLKTGDDGVEALIEQMIEALFSSKNVEEIYAEDNDIRKFISEVLKKYLDIDASLDRDVRGRLRNLREGTPDWDIEYARLATQMKKQRGIA